MLLVVLGFFWWTQNTLPAGVKNEPQSFLITRGSGAIKIADNLEKQGILKSALAFKIYTRLTGQESKIKAGEYELSPTLNLYEIVNELVKGPKEVWVTIPEGLRREEVVEIFIKEFGIKDQAAMDFRNQFLSLTKGKEGYLYPDTYLFPKTTSSEKVVALLLSTFSKKTASLGQLSTDKLSENNVVTVASLLERETVTEEEKPIVAGIILKRLENDWPLQIDASVQYAVGDTNKWWPILTKEDINISSPYNTYKNRGLPPAPIASPGVSSVAAVLNAQESEYWFYIHAKGKIYYAETLEQHNENIRKYLGK